MAADDAFNFLDFPTTGGSGSKLDEDFLTPSTLQSLKSPTSSDTDSGMTFAALALDSDLQVLSRGTYSTSSLNPFPVHVPSPISRPVALQATSPSLFLAPSYVPIAPITPLIVPHFPKVVEGERVQKTRKSQPRSSTAQPEKKARKTGKNLTGQVERASARKEKHRLIDRARRKRVKNSIDQLRDLVKIEAHEKADKATIVSSAVREIQDLKSQLAKLQLQLAQASTKPLFVTTPSDHEVIVPASPEKVAQERSTALVPLTIPPTSFFGGLGGAGVCISVIGLDCKVKDVNGLFETITGFHRDEIVGNRWIDPPLYGRHVHGEFPSNFVRSSDPRFAWVPTASSNDFTCDDFKRAVNALVHGGTFKVVSRVLTRDGSILESLQTIFLMRGDTNALTAVSTPDTRRLIHLPSEPIEFPASKPKGRVFTPEDFLKTPEDFLKSLISQ